MGIKVKAAARNFLIMALPIIMAHCAWGQLSSGTQNPVQTPPPKIDFLPWNEVRSDDTSTEYSVQFPSAVQTPYPENNTVHLTCLMPSDRVDAVPAVVILHYWGAYDLFVEKKMAAQLNRHGIGAVIVSLPYHLQRTPKGHISGELAIQANPTALGQTMLQSVLDVRRTIDWIQSRSELQKGDVGLAGTSLGTIVASLVLGVEPRVKSAVFLIGGVDLAGIMWNSSRVVQQRESLRRDGFNESVLRERLVAVEPATYLKTAPPRPALVIGAKYDTIVPSQYTQELINLLHEPVVQWLPTGHFGGALAQHGILRAQTDFFVSSFTGTAFRKDLSLNAPTIRFGVIYDGGTPEVAAGIDLIHTKSTRQKWIVSALASPRRFRIVGGYLPSANMMLGVSLSNRRVSPGVFWSFVF